MPTVEEKAAFTERLRFAMKRAPEKLRGCTDLAMHFNLRYHGAHPVSPQTVHKWLSGRTIPKADKLLTLAQWFHVDQHWLRYGPPLGGAEPAAPGSLPSSSESWPMALETLELVSKIDALTPRHRYLVQELIAEFYRKR